MSETRKCIAAGLLSALLVAICLGWLLLGSKIDVIALQVDQGNGIDAGPLSDGIRLEQDILIPEGMRSDRLHLGIQFATYSRTNFGHIRLAVEQGAVELEQIVRSSKLKDNTTVYFAFPGLQAGSARLIIEGLDGPAHKSATVWCRYSSEYAPMLLNGELSDRRVDVWFAHKTESREVILNRVGLGGLIFLSLVALGVLTTLMYRSWVEINFLQTLFRDVQSILAPINLRQWLVSVAVSLLVGGVMTLAIFLMSNKKVSYLPLDDIYSEEWVPVNPLVQGTVVEQAFEVTPRMARGEIALGLRFGTYLRTNTAKLELAVSQNDKRDQVELSSKTIEDGQEQIYRFSQFEAGPAKLTISGVNGKGSNSPTVWFEPSDQEPFAVLNGETVAQRLILYRYRVISEERSYPLGGYKFPIWWVVTVTLLVFAFVQIRGPKLNTAARES